MNSGLSAGGAPAACVRPRWSRSPRSRSCCAAYSLGDSPTLSARLPLQRAWCTSALARQDTRREVTVGAPDQQNHTQPQGGPHSLPPLAGGAGRSQRGAAHMPGALPIRGARALTNAAARGQHSRSAETACSASALFQNQPLRTMEPAVVPGAKVPILEKACHVSSGTQYGSPRRGHRRREPRRTCRVPETRMGACTLLAAARCCWLSTRLTATLLPRAKLFIGGISANTNDGARCVAIYAERLVCGSPAVLLCAAVLREHFGRYGSLLDAVVLVDRSTGRSRGFAFVQFESADVAAAVCAGEDALSGCAVVTLSKKQQLTPRPRLLRGQTLTSSTEERCAFRSVGGGRVPRSWHRVAPPPKRPAHHPLTRPHPSPGGCEARTGTGREPLESAGGGGGEA